MQNAALNRLKTWLTSGVIHDRTRRAKAYRRCEAKPLGDSRAGQGSRASGAEVETELVLASCRGGRPAEANSATRSPGVPASYCGLITGSLSRRKRSSAGLDHA